MIQFASARTSSPPSVPSRSSPPSSPSLPTSPPPPASPSPPRPLEWLSDEIARVSAHIQAATYRLLCLIREFDEREGWQVEGFRSCARWLSWRTGVAPGAAREKVRVARALARLPCLSEALRKGELSYSAARALTRVATPENEEQLLEVARHTTAAELEKLAKAWRVAERANDPEAERERHARRELWVTEDVDGSWVIRGRLDPEVGAALRRALEAADEALYAGGAVEPETPPEARRADALGLVAESALAGHLRARVEDVSSNDPASSRGPAPVVGRAERFQVVVHVSAETLSGAAEGPGSGRWESRIEDGPPVSAETCRRLACDAGLVVMTEDAEGNVLDVGRKTRKPPPAIRRALARRDGGCRFPGCASRFCATHHLHHWAKGGPTKLDNLALLCRRHHRLVHEGGWRMEMDKEGEATFYRPDGRPHPTVPPPASVPEDSVGTLEREQPGLGIDSWTPTPDWDGDPLDVDWALFTLWQPPPEEETIVEASAAAAAARN